MDRFSEEYDSGSEYDDILSDEARNDESTSTSSFSDQHCSTCQKQQKGILFCGFCNLLFCQTCWSKFPLHQPGHTSRDGRPHEPCDFEVVKRLDQAFTPPKGDLAQTKLHKEDHDTTWFSVEKNEGELPQLCGSGRYTALMASGPVGTKPRHPRLVSFVGETGAGKSTLIKIIIEQQASLARNRRVLKVACRAPIPGVVKNDSTPTSGDVHLYADPTTFLEQTPILYADCEGLDGGEATPVSVVARNAELALNSFSTHGRRQGRRLKQTKHIARAIATRERLRCELTWSEADPEMQKREFAVAELYPRLLYTFSDVIVFVLRNAKTFESKVLRRLIDWAEGPLEKSTNQSRLPYAIIALNATDIDASEELWDCDRATQKLMTGINDVINRDPHYKKLSSKWKARGKEIKTTQDLLECYYSSIRVVRIPVKGQDKLVDQQAKTLYEEITNHCGYSFNAKREAHELLTVDEFQQYIESAFVHFSRNKDVAFDFVEEGIKLNPIPRGLKDNIVKFLSLVRNLKEFQDRPTDVFEHVGKIVAACIVLDCTRERRRGRFSDLFEDHYRQICIDAFDMFSDTLWPCAFFDKKGHCVNVKNRHNKGHQVMGGPLMSGGQYKEPVPFPAFRADWIGMVKQHLEKIGRRVEREVPFGKSASKGAWAEEVHQSELQRAYRLLGDAKRFKSHMTCFCCLTEMPEYPLPCGHVLCERCISAYGVQKDQTTTEIKGCPLEGIDFPASWLVRSKPVNAGVRILSLDGGGVRGIIELEVLRSIEEHFGDKIPIQRFFDLIVGTSTGGIIALALGAKQWPVKECIDWYKRLSKQAFTTKLLSGPLMMSTRYKSGPLKKALTQAFGESNLFGGTQDNHGTYSTKVAVTASTDTGQQAALFANYNRPNPVGQSYKFVRKDSPVDEMLAWEAARATSAAPGFFEPFYKRETNEYYVDGAVFYNNPATIALQESRAIWPNNLHQPPDILLSLGTGSTIESGSERSSQKETSLHRHFCAPLANYIFGDPNYVQRWIWEDTAIFRTLSILRHRAGSVINAQQQWSQFQSTVLGPEAQDEGRYCRISPHIEGQIPHLDDYNQMPSLQRDVHRKLHEDPLHKDQIAQVAHRLVASSFYFDKVEEIISNDDWYHVSGTILCRFPDQSDDLRHLGEVLKKHQFQRNQPFFEIQHELKMTIDPETVNTMANHGYFSIENVCVSLRDKQSQAMIEFGWLDEMRGDIRLAPISGFPRPILAHDRVRKETLPGKRYSGPRWPKSPTSIQHSQRSQSVHSCPPRVIPDGRTSKLFSNPQRPYELQSVQVSQQHPQEPSNFQELQATYQLQARQELANPHGPQTLSQLQAPQELPNPHGPQVLHQLQTPHELQDTHRTQVPHQIQPPQEVPSSPFAKYGHESPNVTSNIYRTQNSQFVTNSLSLADRQSFHAPQALVGDHGIQRYASSQSPEYTDGYQSPQSPLSNRIQNSSPLLEHYQNLPGNPESHCYRQGYQQQECTGPLETSPAGIYTQTTQDDQVIQKSPFAQSPRSPQTFPSPQIYTGNHSSPSSGHDDDRLYAPYSPRSHHHPQASNQYLLQNPHFPASSRSPAFDQHLQNDKQAFYKQTSVSIPARRPVGGQTPRDDITVQEQYTAGEFGILGYPKSSGSEHELGNAALQGTGKIPHTPRNVPAGAPKLGGLAITSNGLVLTESQTDG